MKDTFFFFGFLYILQRVWSRRFHGNVITLNRCVGIAWDNKRVSSETVTTKGPLSSNGSRYIRSGLHSKDSLEVTAEEVSRSLALTTEDQSLSLAAIEDS
jgi:hypothetical protein